MLVRRLIPISLGSWDPCFYNVPSIEMFATSCSAKLFATAAAARPAKETAETRGQLDEAQQAVEQQLEEQFEHMKARQEEPKKAEAKAEHSPGRPLSAFCLGW